MKKIFSLFLLMCFISGCATYKFQKGVQAPYDNGYVVMRDKRVINEYTLGKDNTVPQELNVAQKRFKRRRSMVEYYYKKMGYIESSFRQNVLNPPSAMLGFITGLFRLPFIAISDYRYEHNPKYKARVLAKEEKEDQAQEARVQTAKEKLTAYIQKDLAKEENVVIPAKAGIQGEPATVAVVEPVAEPVAEPVVVEPAASVAISAPNLSFPQSLSGNPGEAKTESLTAIITANPKKGMSPLIVHFSGNNSRSLNSKIVSYHWDFGDGDTSEIRNPVNTFFCTNFGVTPFTVTLTVKDSQGNTAVAITTINVSTK